MFFTEPHLPMSAQATNAPHNHWRYRRAPTGSATHKPWHQNVWFIVLWSSLAHVEATQFQTLLVVAPKRESKKNFQNVLMLQIQPKKKQKLFWIRNSCTFWGSNIFDPIQKLKKKKLAYFGSKSPSQRLLRLLWSVDFPLLDYFPPVFRGSHRQFSRNKLQLDSFV